MDTQLLQLSYSLDNIGEAVEQFWDVAHQYRIFAFSGDMGAGKTTFIHFLCDYLQVQDTVSSPTFALINEYHFTDKTGADNTIYHLDWYRLKDSREAFDAGMEDCVDKAVDKKAWCLIEWPEKARDLLRRPYLWIAIETINATERKMTITAVS